MDTSLFRTTPLPRSLWTRLTPYGIALASSGAAFELSSLARVWLERTPMLPLYGAVFMATRFGNGGAGLLASAMTTALAAFLILPAPPGPTASAQLLAPLVLYFAGCLVVVSVVGKLRQRSRTLHDKEAQLTDFVENARIGMHWVGPDGRILWANKAMLVLLGRAPEEYVGHPTAEFYADPRVAEDVSLRLAANESLKNYEARLKTKDGLIKTVLIDSDAGPRRVQTVHTRCLFFDITRRKKAEEALQQSEKRFRQLAEHIRQIFWLWDIPTDRIVYVSPAFDDVWGMPGPRTDEPSDFFQKMVYPDDQPAYREGMQLLRGGGITVLEYRIVRPDGAVRWIWDRGYPIKNESGELCRIAGIAEDITDRKRVERDLMEKETKFRAVFESSLDAIQVSKNGLIVFVNVAFLRLFGCARHDDAAGRPVLDFVAPQQRGLVAERIERRERGETVPSRYETLALRRDGSSFDVKVDVSKFELHGEAHHMVIVREITTQKIAEAALRASERKYRDLVETSSDLIWSVDPAGLCTFANGAFHRILGYEPTEMLGRHFAELATEAHATEELEMFAHAQQGRSRFHYETEFAHRNGNAVRLRCSCLWLRDDGGRLLGATCMANDITAHRQAEEALRRSEASLRLAQRIGRIGSWEANLATSTLSWSEETYRIFGCRPENFTPNETSFFNLVHPDDRAHVRKAAETAGIARKRYSVDYRIVRPDGVERFVTQQARLLRNEQGQVIQLVGTVQDITERKEAENELAEQRNLLRTLIDNLPDYVYTKDTAGRYVTCNSAHARFGTSGAGQGFLGKTVFDFFPPEMARRYFEDDQRVVTANQPLFDREEPLLLPDGAERVLLTTKLPLRDADGRVTGLVGISRDITERKMAEAAIQKLNEELEDRVVQRTSQLQEANRELEAFSYSISHDLHAPLRTIDGFAHIIEEDYATKLDPEGLRLFKVISESAKKMGQLIDDLLAFSKLNRLEIHAASVDMGGVARSVIHDLTLLEANRGVDFVLGELPPAHGDAALLRQVWTNLLANALKFTQHAAAPRIEVGTLSEGNELTYFVRDNGAGFDMKYAGKLFKVFQRLHTQKQFTGTGVGLAIVHRIITRHGGQIRAEGKIDEGATIYFSLPPRSQRDLMRASLSQNTQKQTRYDI